MQKSRHIVSFLPAATGTLLALAFPASAQNLAATAISVSKSSVKPGEQFEVRSTIKNTSIWFSTKKSVQSAYYLSSDIVLDSKNDHLLGTFTTPILGATKSHKHSMKVNMPNNIKSRTYYVFVFADSQNKLLELNKLDNMRMTTITGRNTDLVATLVAPGPLTAGTSIGVTVKASNLGTLAAAGTTALLFLSPDPFITTKDVFVGSVNVPSLGGRTSIQIKTTVNLPHCHSYYSLLGQTSIGVMINPATSNRVREGNYDNNTSSLLRFLTPSKTSQPILEWRPTFREDNLGTISASVARFRLAKDSAAGKMCITAPQDRGTPYVLVWSNSPNGFQWDRFSSISVANLASPLFPGWLGTVALDGSVTNLGQMIPRMQGVFGFSLFTYHYYARVKGSGFGKSPVRADYIK